MDGASLHTRCYLFLQGMATPFFARLGVALAARGHAVHRINFTAGDRLYWRLPGSVGYRGTLEDWPCFLERCLNDWRTTDIILFGDWRPLHAVAIRIAAFRGITVHVFEEGYLRPHWVTLEEGGVNKNSSLSRDPSDYLQAAASLPPWTEPRPVRGPLFGRAVHDILYHLCSLALAWRHPGYRSHLPLNPFLEYAGWIRRFVRAPITRRRTETALASLSTGDRPFFLLPLQLDSDSQLRINSPFGRLAPAVELILDSFARSAPPETLLVLKEHPLDPQLIDWRRLAHDRARRLGIADRILYLYGGDLRSLIERSRGVVTVNSTSGILALSLGVPVVALASPIYELPGLTFPGGLDGFWRGAGAPDPVLFDAFRRVVAVRTQVNGGFFSRKALALAVEGSVARLEAAAAGRALVEISHVAPSGVDASAATAMARDATR